MCVKLSGGLRRERGDGEARGGSGSSRRGRTEEPSHLTPPRFPNRPLLPHAFEREERRSRSSRALGGGGGGGHQPITPPIPNSPPPCLSFLEQESSDSDYHSNARRGGLPAPHQRALLVVVMCTAASGRGASQIFSIAEVLLFTNVLLSQSRRVIVSSRYQTMPTSAVGL